MSSNNGICDKVWPEMCVLDIGIAWWNPQILIAYPQSTALQSKFWALNPPISTFLPQIFFTKPQFSIVNSSFSKYKEYMNISTPVAHSWCFICSQRWLLIKCVYVIPAVFVFGLLRVLRRVLCRICLLLFKRKTMTMQKTPLNARKLRKTVNGWEGLKINWANKKAKKNWIWLYKPFFCWGSFYTE